MARLEEKMKKAHGKIISAKIRSGQWEVVSETGSAFKVIRSRMSPDEIKELSVDRRLSEIKGCSKHSTDKEAE